MTSLMRIDNLYKFKLENLILMVTLLIVGVSAVMEHSPARYIKYLVPFYVVYASLLKKQQLVISLPKSIYPFLLLIFYAILNMFLITFLGIKDLFFISAGFVFFIFFYKNNISISKVNYFLLIIYILLQFNNFNFSSSFSLKESTSFVIVESNYPTILGMFCLAAFLNKKWILFLLNIVLMILNMKRITLLAVIFALVGFSLPKKLKAIVFSPLMMVLINIAIVYLLILFTNGSFDAFFEKVFGMSSSWISQGRFSLYQGVVAKILANPMQLLVGFGAGTAYPLTMGVMGDGITNLHSDILKILFEYGIFIFISFFFLLYKNTPINVRFIVFYFNLNLIVDNILIFSHILFFFFLIMNYYNIKNLKCKDIPRNEDTAHT